METQKQSNILDFIAPATGLLGAGINALSQANANKKAREYNTKMYDKQKSDNLEFWNMQNDYNSPQSQMQRLQEAGLNPNMVYGSGNAITPAGKIGEASALPYKPTAPQIDVPSIVDSYFNVKAKSQTVDNMKQQGNILAIEAAQKALDLQFSKDTLHDRKFLSRTRAGQSQADYLNKVSIFQRNTGNYLYDPKLINEGSMFSLDIRKAAAGLASVNLLNKLRSQEHHQKDVLFNTNLPAVEAEASNRQRLADPSISGMSFKDWINMIFTGIRSAR